jgi:hypothetical protein
MQVVDMDGDGVALRKPVPRKRGRNAPAPGAGETSATQRRNRQLLCLLANPPLVTRYVVMMMSPVLRNGPCSVALLIGGVMAGCGGISALSTDDANDSGAPAVLIGAVDLSQAPVQLEMTCDHGVGALALAVPCEVGNNLQGPNPDQLGLNEVECHMTTSGQPRVWSFLLVFSQILQDPSRPVVFPNVAPTSQNPSVDFLPSPTPSMPTDVDGEPFSPSDTKGTISFLRIDSPGRAFIALLKGTIVWTSSTGSTFSCNLDGPFWGRPGTFT